MSHFPIFVLKEIILLLKLVGYLRRSVTIWRETNTMKMQHFIHAVIVSCKIEDFYIIYYSVHFQAQEYFRYTCIFSGRHHNVNLFSWLASVSARCCQNCDGVVYKPDSVMETKQREDKCQTVETSVCRILPGLDQHIITEERQKITELCNYRP